MEAADRAARAARICGAALRPVNAGHVRAASNGGMHGEDPLARSRAIETAFAQVSDSLRALAEAELRIAQAQVHGMPVPAEQRERAGRLRTTFEERCAALRALLRA